LRLEVGNGDTFTGAVIDDFAYSVHAI